MDKRSVTSRLGVLPHAPWGSRLHASAVRLVLFGLWLSVIAATPYERYAQFPPEMLQGYGIGRLITDVDVVRRVVVTQSTLFGLKLAALVAGVVVLFSRHRSRWLSVPFLLLVAVLDSVTKATGGYVNHAQTIPLLALFVVAGATNVEFLPAQAIFRPAAWRIRTPGSDTEGHAVVVWLVAIVLVLPYSYIGLNRLLWGGIPIFTGDALLNYVAVSSKGFSALPAWLSVDVLGGLFRLGFLAVTLFEVAAPLVLFSFRFRVWWLMMMGVFHVGTLAVMNIFFWENLLVALAVLWWGWHGPSEAPPRTMIVPKKTAW